MKSLIILGLLFGTTATCFCQQHPVNAMPPGFTPAWDRSTPESQGLSSGSLNEMFEYIRTQQVRVHSIQVIRHSHLVLDAYFFPYAPQSKHDVASVTKSVTSTLTGIAIDQHHISSIKDPALSYIPGQGSSELLRQKITLEDLITMRSGLDCGTNMSDPDVNRDRRLEEIRKCPDWMACILKIPIAATPGTTFSYCNANCHWLSAIVQRATGKNLAEFGQKHLFGPIGITDFHWPQDPQGICYGWSDLQLHPYDMLRIGELMLKQGNWEGRQIVSAQWLKAATAAHVTNTGNSDRYGYYWWSPGGDYPDVFEAVGRGGQRITVWPSRDMVIVFTGGGFNTAEIVPFIVKAIKSDQAIPEAPHETARLAANIRKAAEPPVPISTAKLPDLAENVSSKTYSISENSLAIDAIQFRFDGTKETNIYLHWLGQQVLCKTGLDGVPRFSLNPLLGLDQACHGIWVNDNTFEMVIDLVGGINSYIFQIRFDEQGQKLTIKAREITGLADEIFEGRSME